MDELVSTGLCSFPQSINQDLLGCCAAPQPKVKHGHHAVIRSGMIRSNHLQFGERHSQVGPKFLPVRSHTMLLHKEQHIMKLSTVCRKEMKAAEQTSSTYYAQHS